MKATCTFILFILATITLSAQSVSGQNKYCYTDEIWAQMARRDPSLLLKRQQMDMAISKYSNKILPANTNQARSLTPSPTTVIPTVIYVLYDTAPANISMAQIQSQMDQLNQNFAAYGYSFCYAKRNILDSTDFVPHAGDSAGVFRISSPLSSVSEYHTDAQLKALSTLPPDNYLRIYIVHSITPQGVLGYTVMPGSYSPDDGIVMRYDAFGSTNFCSGCQLIPGYTLGAALTHEVGHYFNLYHTFQGGCDTGSLAGSCQYMGDWVCDTPPTDGSFGCPSPAPLSCDGVHPELIENYMDYTDDPCKNSFTSGQKTRMDFSVQAYRAPLVTLSNLINTGVTCVQVGSAYADFDCTNYNGCLNQPMTFSSLHSSSFTYTWDFGDGHTGTGDTVHHTYTTAGQYQVSLRAVSASLSIDVSSSSTVFITVCTSISCPVDRWDFEYGAMDFSTGTPVPINHATEYNNPFFADFYACFSRQDATGHPLFYISSRAMANNTGTSVSAPSTGLLDQSFSVVDSFGIGDAYTLAPVPHHANTYCLIGVRFNNLPDYLNSLDTLAYSIIQPVPGSVRVTHGKRLVNVPFPSGFSNPYYYTTTAVSSCDGEHVWIIANTFDNQFYVFQLDSSGTLSFVQNYSAAADAQYMVASPDGRKILTGNYLGSATTMSILDFDKATGHITADNILYSTLFPNYNYSAGIGTFSPNSRFIYQAEECCYAQPDATGELYQYDLSNPQPYASRRLVSQYIIPHPEHAPQCFNGPDKKIYVGTITQPGNSPNSYRLSVIGQPNTLDNGLNAVAFNPKGPYIVPPGCPYSGVNINGFYGFYDYTDAFGCSWQPGVPAMFSYTSHGCLHYQFQADDCYSAQWSFGDPLSGTANTSTSSTPTHIFSGPGSYVVRLLTGGYTFVDTVHISIAPVLVSGSPVHCTSPFATYSIGNIQPFIDYKWIVTNGQPATAENVSSLNVNWNPADTLGTIMVIATDTVMGCIDTATLHIRYRQPSFVVTWTTGADTFDVHSGGITLSGGTPAGGTYSGSGVHGSVFYPDSGFVGPHVLTYTYTSPDGCTGSATRVVTVLGIGDVGIYDRIYLYPNPANNLITAHSDIFATANNLQIQVYDMTGRQIFINTKRAADKVTFDISALSHGVYNIRFTIDGQEAIKRFVKIE